MTVETTYKEFLYLLQVSQPIKDIQTEFANWNAKPVDEGFYRFTDFAVIMQVALYFEANRPFDLDWYGTPTEFNTKSLDECKFPALPAPGVLEVEKIREAIENLEKVELPAYREEVKEYLEKLPPLGLP